MKRFIAVAVSLILLSTASAIAQEYHGQTEGGGGVYLYAN